MGKENVTLKDIAKVAGVSPATASLALTGDPRVNAKTQQTVKEVAKRLHYVPNEIGRSLRAKKAETIALIFPTTPGNAFTHPYFVHLLQGITEVLVRNSYHLLLSTSPTEEDEAAAYDKILRTRRADGIILWPASIKDQNIHRIVESGFPVVYLGKWHHNDVVTIERDEVGGAYLATDHLLRLGRKRILHIAGFLDFQVSKDRLEGYKQALQEHHVDYDSSLLIEKDYFMEGGYEAVMEAREKGLTYDAIFAGNDLMAVGAMKALQDNGVAIPDEVSVVGCDNIDMATMTNPTLTTVYQPMKQIGMIAAEKMMSLVHDENVGEKQTVVPTRLIVRESCGKREQ